MSMPTVRNRITGQVFTPDPTAARLARLRGRIFAWAEICETHLSDRKKYFVAMVTLTYERTEDWRPLHVRDLLKGLRRRYKERLLAYAWVAELQKRGAVHYHLLMVVSRGVRIPKLDNAGLWVYGMTRVERAKTLYYICKYTTKGNDENGNRYPKGCRSFGVYLDTNTVRGWERENFRRSVYPKWLREVLDLHPLGATARRERGGGWRIGDSVYISPYIYSREDGV